MSPANLKKNAPLFFMLREPFTHFFFPNSSYVFGPTYPPLILILTNLDDERNKSILVSSQNKKLHKQKQYYLIKEKW